MIILYLLFLFNIYMNIFNGEKVILIANFKEKKLMKKIYIPLIQYYRI